MDVLVVSLISFCYNLPDEALMDALTETQDCESTAFKKFKVFIVLPTDCAKYFL